MSKKDLLKEKAKSKLATGMVKPVELKKAVALTGTSELVKITREIKTDLDEMRDISEWWNEKKLRVNELKENIITKLMYVRDNKKSLLPDRTFESYLSEDIGISKGYFYEQLQAYNICVEYKKPKLFKEVDHKVLVNIAREEDKEKQRKLIEKAPDLSREYFKKDKEKVSPTDFSKSKENLPSLVSAKYSLPKSSDKQKPGVIALDLLRIFKELHDKEKMEFGKTYLSGYMSGIIGFSSYLNEGGIISDSDYEKIKKFEKQIKE